MSDWHHILNVLENKKAAYLSNSVEALSHAGTFRHTATEIRPELDLEIRHHKRMAVLLSDLSMVNRNLADECSSAIVLYLMRERLALDKVEKDAPGTSPEANKEEVPDVAT